MRILSSKDILEIVSQKELTSAIENAFKLYKDGNFMMPDRSHIHNKDNTLLLMPCFTESYFGTKLVTVNPKNVDLGKPTIYGSMILNDRISGEAIAYLNGATLTMCRTAAVGAVAARYLAPKIVNAIGIIGMGTQGFMQALYICEETNAKKVVIYDPYYKNIDKRREELLAKINEKHTSNFVEVIIANSERELVQLSNIIITATGTSEPILPNDPSLLKGKTFIGIGSYKPTMREFPDALFKLVNNVYCDTEFASKESGDLAIPIKKGLLKEENIYNLEDLITSKEPLNSTTNFFKSVGMALFDVVAASYIYEEALRKDIGTNVDM